MAFTKKDLDVLVQARRTVAELEHKETEALQAVRDALYNAGFEPRSNAWRDNVYAFAGEIRDALEPFDSGVRMRADPPKDDIPF